MKQNIFILILLLMPSLTYISGQSQTTDKRSKKALKKEQLDKEFKTTRNMLMSRDFVLEADHLMDKWGNRAYVSSNINFVKVDSSTAIIQVGSNHNLGRNGVGGVTAKGKITGWDITVDPKRKSFYVQLNVMTNIGIYDVNISVSAYGDATASVTGLRLGRLTFEGDVVPLNNTIVYEGSSI